ncbi:unnamed protein product [Rhizophagus irregularis]|nr:unnamed protein product [Rhizophagus irregularis]
MSFLSIAQSLIKSNTIWKHRSTSWKQWKLSNGITKNHFKKYRQTSPIQRSHTTRTTEEDVRPRSNIRTRSRHNSIIIIIVQTLFIIFSSSNFLHSGTFFQHIDHSLSLDGRTSSIDNRHVEFYV